MTEFRRIAAVLSVIATISGTLIVGTHAQGNADGRHPVKRAESRDQWYADGRRAIEAAKRVSRQRGRAKNVILFVGDGMGLSTVILAVSLVVALIARLNVGFYSAYFWDGRAATLEEQALFPIQSPEEMNQNLDALENELNAIPGYVSQFKAVFGSDATRSSVARAPAAFQRTLVSRNSPFDRYLSGDTNALSEEALRGWNLFRGDAGCIRCHNGPNLTDSKFYRLGTTFADRGRGAITGVKRDDYAFRTPGLRDVAKTAPYMHDGSFETLSQVVEFYYRGSPLSLPDGLPLDITALIGRSYSEISAVVALLESLNGEIPEISPPALP